jgi:hypothetical protein
MEALGEWVKRTGRMRDDEGRPLGESKAPPGQLHGVPLELRICPYAGSRLNHDRPMNVSALKQMLAHWEEVRGGIALLRSLYCAEAGRERLRLIDVWRLAGLTGSVADFAFLRAWDPVGDGELPAAVAVLYKAPLGVTLTTQAMWADGAARFDALAEADALYEYADRSGHFIGPQQVCAGPVALIREVLHLLVHGGGQGNSAAAAGVIGDRRRFLRFAHGAASLALLHMALDRLDARLGFDLARALAADPAAPALPETVCRKARVARFHGFDTGARPDVVEDLFAQAADTGFAPVDLGPGTRAIYETWVRPLEDAAAPILRVVAASPRVRSLHPETSAAVGRHLARYCAVELGFAGLVRLLKGPIAAALGVEPAHPRARELHLVDYVPSGLGLMRTILRDALAIDVRAEGGRLFLACGDLSCEFPGEGRP